MEFDGELSNPVRNLSFEENQLAGSHFLVCERFFPGRAVSFVNVTSDSFIVPTEQLFQILPKFSWAVFLERTAHKRGSDCLRAGSLQKKDSEPGSIAPHQTPFNSSVARWQIGRAHV